MNRNIFFIVWILLAVLINTPSYADDKATKLVAVSSSLSKASEDRTIRDEKCNATFPGSHWCDTSEYAKGGIYNRPEAGTEAWIAPTIISSYFDTVAGDVRLVDTTGYLGSDKSINCQQWTTDYSGFDGLIVVFQTECTSFVNDRECNQLLPNACCAEVK